MVKSKTTIEKQLKRKTNPVLVETIILAKKNPAWTEVAGLLTTPGRKSKSVNLSEIEKADGEMIVVPGKVLSQGEIKKKVKVVATNFSESALKKLKDAGCEALTIKDAIKLNKDGKGMVILK